MKRFLLAPIFVMAALCARAQSPADLAFHRVDPPVSTASKAVLASAPAFQPAHYAGGERALHEQLQDQMTYPEPARRNGIEGTVRVAFRVAEDGTLSGLRVLRSAHPLLDDEALRVIARLTDWQPAEYGGRKIERTTAVNIRFRLP